MKEDKGSFYVGLHEPNEFRKELLSACKNAIVMLKRFEIHKERRKLKAELQAELHKKLKEVQFLSNKLKGYFPDHHLRSQPLKRPRNKSTSASVAQPARKSPKKDKHLSEIDRLERELQNIERKMSFING